MDWSLLDLAKDAEDVASGLQAFVDALPGCERDFLAHISALFAISAELRRLDELVNHRSFRRAAAQITPELDLLCPSLESTLETVKIDLFGVKAAANPRRAYERLCGHFDQEGRSFAGRLVAYHDLTMGLSDILQGTRCLGRDIPEAVNRLFAEGFQKVVEQGNQYGNRLDLWANLRFTCYERMVLFFCTAVALKRQDAIESPLRAEDFFQNGEDMEFSGEINDDHYLHAFRVFKDRNTGAVRFEATARRGPMQKTPIWTAFVTEYIGRKGWMRRVGPKILSISVLHPYIFCDNYSPPRGRDGQFELRFTSRKGAFNVVIT
ncbi:hypothetical protein SLS58_001090 [Diplodia intermedia]|uniref:Uncharacterized protein n=1 Tax=Diplodia intermedia TaxID=856260 RepID=A0ABR3U426_9PEZI